MRFRPTRKALPRDRGEHPSERLLSSLRVNDLDLERALRLCRAERDLTSRMHIDYGCHLEGSEDRTQVLTFTERTCRTRLTVGQNEVLAVDRVQSVTSTTGSRFIDSRPTAVLHASEDAARPDP